jgi:hypothetical protein
MDALVLPHAVSESAMISDTLPGCGHESGSFLMNIKILISIIVRG